MSVLPTEPWDVPPSPLALPDDEVHVWRIALDRTVESIQKLESILSDDERERAARFRADIHRTRFIAGRGSLRTVLGGYRTVPPQDIAFRYEDFGKPAMTHPADGIEFNLTHSHGLALLAVARGRRLGIDLERIRDVVDDRRIVERFFSVREQEDYARLPDDRKREGFFRGWTRKEAYLKAIGIGISMPLDKFTVSLDPEEPALLRKVVGKPEEATRWRFANVDPEPGFVGAIAVEGSGWQLQSFTFSFDVGREPHS